MTATRRTRGRRVLRGDWATEAIARVERSRRALVVVGIGLVVALVAGVGVILSSFLGKFTSYVGVSAVLPAGSNAVETGSPVVYRDVTVGKVASSGTIIAAGKVRVALHMKPNQMGNIPAGVTASIAPLTVFGTQAVILEPPPTITTARLARGAAIPVETGRQNTSIQDTITSLYNVLSGIHPAELDEALTAFATALDGEGKPLGQTLVSMDAYLKQMLPQFPTLEADLALLAPVANQVAASSPNLLGTLANLTVTSKTFTAQQQQLHQLLVNANQASNQGAALLQATQAPLEALVANTAPLLQDLAITPTEIPAILSGLNQWATTWTAAEQQGPYISMSTSVPVSNATDLVLAGAQATGAAGYAAAGLDGRVNPPTYTAADRPCFSCAGPATTTAATETLAPAIVDPRAEQPAINTIVAAGGGTPSAAPNLTTLLLGGLLASGAQR